MGELHTYQFPARASAGVLFGLSAARLATVAVAGVVFIAVMARPTTSSVIGGLAVIGLLLAATAARIKDRAVVDWLPVWASYGWSLATRSNEFYTSPDLSLDLPDGVLDLPGEVFGIELHQLTPTATADDAAAGYGVVSDTFRGRMIAVCELSAGDFLYLDPADQQSRISAWGGLLDHVAQTLPELCRLQVVHTVGAASTASLEDHHGTHGGRGTETTAASYHEVVATAGRLSQEHRVLLAVALDRHAARRAIRQAGGGTAGAAQVLMDRAAVVEEALTAAGLDVHGWLPAHAIAQILRGAFDPAARRWLDHDHDDATEEHVEVSAGPTGMVDGWAAVRHDSAWSTTLHVSRPPARPVTGDFLQHLLVGVPAARRTSMLYVPTPMAEAERRAQTQQTSTESEQHLRARWGFGQSARHRRDLEDAARREDDVVAGRAVYRLVWMVTVTAADLADLEASVGQVEAAARRCGLELQRMAGTQRQAFCFTLPLCRGAR